VSRPAPPARVPTLTEVVRLPDVSVAPSVPASTGNEGMAGEGEAPRPAAAPAAAPVAAAPLVERRAVPPISEDQVVQRVLADLQRQIELMLEVRLREALAPALTRATDALLREARAELASTLRDVVARAVAQELSRHRGR